MDKIYIFLLVVCNFSMMLLIAANKSSVVLWVTFKRILVVNRRCWKLHISGCINILVFVNLNKMKFNPSNIKTNAWNPNWFIINYKHRETGTSTEKRKIIQPKDTQNKIIDNDDHNNNNNWIPMVIRSTIKYLPIVYSSFPTYLDNFVKIDTQRQRYGSMDVRKDYQIT